MRSRQYDQATVARALETIERSIRSQTHLIEDLLDRSRILRGQMHFIVSVESPGLEQGSTFTVKLPLLSQAMSLQAQQNLSHLSM